MRFDNILSTVVQFGSNVYSAVTGRGTEVEAQRLKASMYNTPEYQALKVRFQDLMEDSPAMPPASVRKAEMDAYARKVQRVAVSNNDVRVAWIAFRRAAMDLPADAPGAETQLKASLDAALEDLLGRKL
jgi:hypothetical protein